MELLELGRRWHVRPKHLVATAIIGIVGGMVIGGWVFLSNAYSLGGETSIYGWGFDTKWWYFFSYNQDMAAATNQYLGQTKGAVETGVNPAWIAAGLSGLAAIVVTVLAWGAVISWTTSGGAR